MFARRHYQVIASIIKNLAISEAEHCEEELREIEGVRQAIAMQFADELGRSNANFNRVKFLNACKAE